VKDNILSCNCVILSTLFQLFSDKVAVVLDFFTLQDKHNMSANSFVLIAKLARNKGCLWKGKLYIS